MKPVIFGSGRENSGKTSIIAGLWRSTGGDHGYIKPMGDRHVYKKKRLWDYDAALMVNAFGLDRGVESITIGFDHSKLRFMYDKDSIGEKLRSMVEENDKGTGTLFIEAGKDLVYGGSVHLDAASISKALQTPLVIVLAGNEHGIMDQIVYAKRYLDIRGAELGGIILNKLKSTEEFMDMYREEIEGMDINILGALPMEPELASYDVAQVVETLFARVIAGEGGIHRKVKNVFVGAMSANAALRNPLFEKEEKLIITSGDRTDMIVAGIENGASGIVLSNNILPPSNIISKATEADTPLLLVPFDTFQVAKKIDDMVPLLNHQDQDRLDRLASMVKKDIDVSELID